MAFFFLLEINFTAMLAYAYPSDIVIITLKFLLKAGGKNLWPFEVGHGMKKVEKHWSKLCFIKSLWLLVGHQVH